SLFSSFLSSFVYRCSPRRSSLVLNQIGLISFNVFPNPNQDSHGSGSASGGGGRGFGTESTNTNETSS
ncbi:hypothetical protein LINPERHAP2_LOCUS4709, partial [Linum perenne]